MRGRQARAASDYSQRIRCASSPSGWAQPVSVVQVSQGQSQGCDWAGFFPGDSGENPLPGSVREAPSPVCVVVGVWFPCPFCLLPRVILRFRRPPAPLACAAFIFKASSSRSSPAYAANLPSPSCLISPVPICGRRSAFRGFYDKRRPTQPVQENLPLLRWVTSIISAKPLAMEHIHICE